MPTETTTVIHGGNMVEDGARPLVLVVDDDPDFLLQEKVQLEAAGFRVIDADSKEKAVGLLEEHRPDLAVIDVMMEDADAGFTLCYAIKKKDKRIPVIIVTSVVSETGMAFDAATEEERSWIMADAFLAKPIRTEQLMKEVRQLLEARK
jgi:two-component system response regulator MprA